MTYKKFSPARRTRDGAFLLESLENEGGCDLSARCCRGIFWHSADMLFKGKRGIGVGRSLDRATSPIPPSECFRAHAGMSFERR